MKDKVILVEMLVEKLEQYGKTNFELYKLQAIDKSTDVFASITSRIVLFSLIALFFFLPSEKTYPVDAQNFLYKILIMRQSQI